MMSPDDKNKLAQTKSIIEARELLELEAIENAKKRIQTFNKELPKQSVNQKRIIQNKFRNSKIAPPDNEPERTKKVDEYLRYCSALNGYLNSAETELELTELTERLEWELDLESEQNKAVIFEERIVRFYYWNIFQNLKPNYADWDVSYLKGALCVLKHKEIGFQVNYPKHPYQLQSGDEYAELTFFLDIIDKIEKIKAEKLELGTEIFDAHACRIFKQRFKPTHRKSKKPAEFGTIQNWLITGRKIRDQFFDKM